MATLPTGALMARAATGLAGAVADLQGGSYGSRVLLLVGSGDNGGDALHAGALLARRGARVEAVLLSDSPHAGGLAAFRRAGGRVVTASDSRRPDVVVDGIVGIGGRPGLRSAAVEALARHREVPVVAVDVPSGVSVDDGRIEGPHVTADLTVTFGTHKVAHLVDPAAPACGVVHLVDIGLDLPGAALTALQPGDVADRLPRPSGPDHKYSRGVVGVRTGTEYPGAGVLSTAGAGCGLAGMVRYAGPVEVAARVQAAHPEVVTAAGRVQAWVVGCGSGAAAADDLAAVLADGVPVVVDADALAHLPTPLPVPAVLTPHAGELARMLGVEREQVEDAQLGFVREAASRWQAVVVLKGRHTLVAEPGGRVRVTTTGQPWLATAGAGDVLAGVVGALLACGLDPFDAASVGSWVHGAAATLASDGGPIVAGDVARALPGAIRPLLG